jgi:hypothetical protein
MSAFRRWYLTNGNKISWFIIGAMCMSGLIYLGSGQYINAVISFAIAGVNWLLSRA